MPGFEEIVGHEQIVTHLKSAMKLGKVSHAYILSGEKGCGKKLLADVFAETLQCEKGGTEPCGRWHFFVQGKKGTLFAAAILVYRHRAATILTSYI